MHRLTEVDEAALTAVCEICGPTRVRRKTHALRCYGASKGNVAGQQRRYALRRRYGLSVEDFDALLLEQTGRCATCTRPLADDLRVDHDHATGRVRGLLCHGCNIGLGGFRDDPAALRAAADYLERARSSPSR